MLQLNFKVYIFGAVVAFLIYKTHATLKDEDELKKFLVTNYEPKALELCNQVALAQWQYATSLQGVLIQYNRDYDSIRQQDFAKNYWHTYFKNLKEDDYEDEIIRRQVRKLKDLGIAALDSAKYKEIVDVQNEMTAVFNNAKICPFHLQDDCDILTEGNTLSHDLKEVMADSMNYERLLYIWEKWGEATGSVIKRKYQRYVQLSKDADLLNGITEQGIRWERIYDSYNFPNEIDQVWNKVKPLYDELHKYTLTKLALAYEDQIDVSDGLIPAHILGDMWGESWVNLYFLLEPYPKSKLDMKKAFKAKYNNVKKMFSTADSFLTSIGLESNERAYNEEMGAGMAMDCQPSAWDFCDGQNYRMKICEEVDYQTFLEMHAELAHIAYAKLYKEQPLIFRTGANPAFRKAVGDAILLSVDNPGHMQEIGILHNYTETDEASLNRLLKLALNKVAFLPFGLLVDKWRWDVFTDKISEENWNSHWWHYRESIQKVKSPVIQTEDNFGPGSKNHITSDYHINSFVSNILQFQIYRGLCRAAKKYNPSDPNKPLHKCDFFKSNVAGDLLKSGLMLGASKPWQQVLKEITGEEELDPEAMIEYFAPLMKYLQECNTAEKGLQETLEKYEVEASSMLNKVALAKWAVAVDRTDIIARGQLENLTLVYNAFQSHWWKTSFRPLDRRNYVDMSLRRQLEHLKTIGNSALNDEDLHMLNGIVTRMKDTYTNLKITPYSKLPGDAETVGLRMEPDIHLIMKTSTDIDELVYYWEAWHEEMGVELKKDYQDYIELSNKAAKANGFLDKGDMWRNIYESEDFIGELDNMWDQLDVYEKLHRFVMRKLKHKYGAQLDVSDGLIPAHVLGVISGESWTSLLPVVKPHIDAPTINLTVSMKEADITALRIFEIANDFYISLGFESASKAYDGNIDRPQHINEAACCSSAWDFHDKQDFRILMCAKSTFEDFLHAHRIMGNIQYYMQYKEQPTDFRTAANPAFLNAVGNAVALSARTPKHLKQIHILSSYDDSIESNRNYLMEVALDALPGALSSLALEKWKWGVFSKKFDPSKLNEEWWILKNTIQRVKSPVPRASYHHFDPVADLHVINDTPYIDEFVQTILTFQIYRDMCIKAGKYDPDTKEEPLHKCDFYESNEVGNSLKAGLSLGASKHWKDVLEAITGTNQLDVTAILEYFEPLSEYLDAQNSEMDETELTDFLRFEYEEHASDILNECQVVSWNQNTNIRDVTAEQEMVKIRHKLKKFDNHYHQTVFRYLDLNRYHSEEIRRQVSKLKLLGSVIDNNKDKFSNIKNNMHDIFCSAAVCPFYNQQCNLTEEGIKRQDIEDILAISNNMDELDYYWKSWRKATGGSMKPTFESYVHLANEKAQANGFRDMGEMWRNEFESDTLSTNLDAIWEQIKPIYIELHRFIGNRLKIRFPNIDLSDGLIPANLLGSLYAQDWRNLAAIAKPYHIHDKLNITSELVGKRYSAYKMYDSANKFYLSLDLESNEVSYNSTLGAIIEDNENQEIDCYPSAWDFSNKKDYRVLTCAEVNHENFVGAHSLLSRIQYYLQYKDQPVIFREAANPAFMEAVSSAIRFSVETPNHLKAIGFFQDVEFTQEDAINFLMEKALRLVAFLPFGIIVDKWRWDVFAGNVHPDEWNEHWWQYRNKYQKLKRPMDSHDPSYLDPVSKMHIAGDMPFINYPIGDILSFQLYRGLCISANQYNPENPSKPLHGCDFYKSREAGKRLRDGLRLGSSKHWKEVLHAITGDNQLDGTAMFEYFEPLLKYLRKENGPMTSQQDIHNFLKLDYEASASYYSNALTVANWNFATDLGNPIKEQAEVTAALNNARFKKDYWKDYFQHLSEADYTDEEVGRQIRHLRVLGSAALDDDKLSELKSGINLMTKIYSTAKICPFLKQHCDLVSEGLSLTPDIEKILATSTNYDELKYLWVEWRKATGTNVKDIYPQYVKLSNEAARLNGFDDMGEMWKAPYESPTFLSDMNRLWQQVTPLYTELHTYTLGKLKEQYGTSMDIHDKYIPAHILGNMWGQSWENLYQLLKPHPDGIDLDITSALKQKAYTPLKMFETANKFFTSLGLASNEISYSEEHDSIIQKPNDTDIVCHASAWDFSNKKDFRIKMCTEVTYDHFKTIHQQMGHIAYYMLYKDQPIAFRKGAHPGFHEAIGDTIALSATTHQHLKDIGLIQKFAPSEKDILNLLMLKALDLVAFLPFGLIVDKWRWDIFSGQVKREDWNSHWWEYRKKFQKIRAPVDLSKHNDFDPGAKMHIVSDSQYIGYFISHILQFQIYRALCITAKQYDPKYPAKQPLQNCDFYNSKQAGDKLRAGLSLGASKHWKYSLKEITGDTNVDAVALLEYFEPLYLYLKAENLARATSGETSHETEDSQPVGQLILVILGSISVIGIFAGVALYLIKRNKKNVNSR